MCKLISFYVAFLLVCCRLRVLWLQPCSAHRLRTQPMGKLSLLPAVTILLCLMSVNMDILLWENLQEDVELTRDGQVSCHNVKGM